MQPRQRFHAGRRSFASRPWELNPVTSGFSPRASILLRAAWYVGIAFCNDEEILMFINKRSNLIQHKVLMVFQQKKADSCASRILSEQVRHREPISPLLGDGVSALAQAID